MRKAMILVLLFILLNPAFSCAITRVFVQNNTPRSYSVISRQSGCQLADSKWCQTIPKIIPGAREQILYFNRDDGIKDGKSFYFTSELSFGDSRTYIYLKQRLKGKMINSHMWQSLQVPGTTHNWYDDRKTHVATFDFDGRPFTVKYRAYFTGTDDNIEYILQQDYDLPPIESNSINLLAYNIYMRPGLLFKNGQSIRVPKIAKHMLKGHYDIIVFSEAFDDGCRQDLSKYLQSVYEYRTRVLGSDRGTEQDGGVIIFSRWPIVEQAQHLFGDVCYGSDCMADKGILYACINKKGKKYHVFGSHTQADASSEDIAMRNYQFKIIKKFIDDGNIPSNEAVIIAGDLNVNMYDSLEYQDMLKTLNAAHPSVKQNTCTFNPVINDLADGGAVEYLDYVLYSKEHLNPTSSYNWPLLLRSSTEWKEFPWETAMWDISDHYPVLGHFEFQTAPSRARVRAPASDETPSRRPGFTRKENTDLFGSDYKSFWLDQPDPGKCEEACAADPKCKAYTYVKPGIQGVNARCWLKNGVPQAKSNSCCISGIKKAPHRSRVRAPASE